jgi:di/tricarboxylate transporter
LDPQVVTLLILLAAAVVLFATELVPVEVTGILLLLALHATGLLGPEDLFAGFGDGVVVFLGSLFVVSAALTRSGALEPFEHRLARLAEARPRLALPALAGGTGLLSAFLSNTATTAAVLPIASGLARRLGRSPSTLLMPIAFASILGGSITLVGTSTNIVVSGMLPRYGLERLGLFELAAVGVPATVLGLAYLLTVGRRLLPERSGRALDAYRLRAYLSEVVVPAGSDWIGRTVAEIESGRRFEINVIGRVAERAIEPAAGRPLEAGDVLLVQGDPDVLLRLTRGKSLAFPAGEENDEAEEGAAAGVEGLKIHEVMLPVNSRLAGSSLRRLRFRSSYGVDVLAIYRRGHPRYRRVADLRLRDGDVLLVQGDPERLGWLVSQGDLILLEELEPPHPGWRAAVAGATFVAMIVAGGAGWLSFPVAALVAATLLVLTGCIRTSEAYAAVDWRILIMVASLLGLATAMETSGAAETLAAGLVDLAGGAGPLTLLAGFYLLTTLLTQPMSNQAAALVVLPFAVRTALALDLDPRAFAVAVCLAGSCSFITPLEPASLLVYGPGRYRFRDYFVVGLPLTLMVFALAMLIVPRVWPL